MKILKKVLYILLLLLELSLDVLLMSIFCAIALGIPCVVIVVVSVGLLLWQIIAFAKTADADKKRRIKRNIALVLLIPTAIFFIFFVWFIVAMMIGF